MKLLAIDFGLKHIGLAISEGHLAEPYPPSLSFPPRVVARGKLQRESIFIKLQKIIKKEKIEKIILGLPEGKLVKTIQDFGQKLHKLTNLPVIFQDETLTSQEAKQKMIEAGKPLKKRQSEDHLFSACLILQNYLDSISSTNHNYFDKKYTKKWFEQANQKRPYRFIFFNALIKELNLAKDSSLSILELGSGPGLLAEHLLDYGGISSYCLFDYSPQMLALAKQRLNRFLNLTIFVNGDFQDDNWIVKIPRDFDAVVSFQAIHEIGNSQTIGKLYKKIFKLLKFGGQILICDLTTSTGKIGSHRLTFTEQRDLLKKAGFKDCKEVLTIEDLTLVKGLK